MTKKEIDDIERAHKRCMGTCTQSRLIAHIRKQDHEMDERSERTTLIHNSLVVAEGHVREDAIELENLRDRIRELEKAPSEPANPRR